MRRFIVSGNRPDQYNRPQLAAEQSDVPSQQTPVPPPFDSSGGGGLPTPPRPAQPDSSIVRASFDSRFPGSYDFFWVDRFDDGASSNTPAYIVPAGFNAILRQIDLNLTPNQDQGPSQNIMDHWGNPNLAGVASSSPLWPKLQILINGISTPFWTAAGPSGLRGVPLYDLLTSAEISIPLFVLIDSGSTMQINIPNFISAGGGNTFNIHAYYYGTLLPDTGRNLINETGNADPLFVQIMQPR